VWKSHGELHGYRLGVYQSYKNADAAKENSGQRPRLFFLLPINGAIINYTYCRHALRNDGKNKIFTYAEGS